MARGHIYTSPNHLYIADCDWADPEPKTSPMRTAKVRRFRSVRDN